MIPIATPHIGQDACFHRYAAFFCWLTARCITRSRAARCKASPPIASRSSRVAAAQLKAGMTREQARSVLGTPLLADMFHANRWDYLFYFRRGETQVVRQRHLTLYFDQDQLTHWSGAEDLPTEYELIAEIDGDKRANTRGRQRRAAKRPSGQSHIE